MFTEEELYSLLEEAFEAGYDSALDEILDESEDSSYDLESEMDAYTESLNAEDKDKTRILMKQVKKAGIGKKDRGLIARAAVSSMRTSNVYRNRDKNEDYNSLREKYNKRAGISNKYGERIMDKLKSDKKFNKRFMKASGKAFTKLALKHPDMFKHKAEDDED